MNRPLRLLVLLAALVSPAVAAAEPPKLRLIDPADAALLMLDHQTGLFQTVKDISLQELRTNATVLAKVAALAKVPVITTASEPNGPNGPLMPELHEAAPGAIYVGRKGEISAWENPDFVKTVKGTGRKTLIMMGVWTSVCVVFPAIQAKAEGYDVYAVMDASGDMSVMASQVSLARLVQARRSDHHQRGGRRVPAHLEPARRREVRRALWDLRAALPSRDRELPEGARSRRQEVNQAAPGNAKEALNGRLEA